jgi:peptidoglycan/LPS O-acetylase OafA/YrhL
VALILVFVGVNRWYFDFVRGGEVGIYGKLLGVSLAPWLYMFLMGVLTQWHFDRVRMLIAGRFLQWSAIYVTVCVTSVLLSEADSGNAIGPFLYVLLVMAVLSAAYSSPQLGERVLYRNDISYGLYIWHMPVINGLIWLGGGHRWLSVPLALGISLLLACLSWFYVERPSLRRKRRSLYGH